MSDLQRALEDIRSRISVSQLVGQSVQLRRRGSEWVGLSPFKKEKTPSFTINDEKGFYHCFASGEHGDIFKWLMKTKGYNFIESAKELAKEAGVKFPTRSAPSEQQIIINDKKADLIKCNQAAAGYFSLSLEQEEGEKVRDYLQNRNIKPENWRQFQIGFASNDGANFLAYMKKQGFSNELLIEAGLVRKYDANIRCFFRNRLMIPITDAQNQVIAFGGRFMGDAAASNTGKYINSPDTEIFHKGRTLYNYASARSKAFKSKQLFVVEGYTDVISLNLNGIEEAVAPLGTAVTETQIQMLWRVVDEPTICLDGDEAGNLAAIKTAERALPNLAPGKSLNFMFLPKDEDPDSFIRQHGENQFRKLALDKKSLLQTLFDSILSNLPHETPEQKARIEENYLQLCQRIKHDAVKRFYQQSFRDLFWQYLRNYKTNKTSYANKTAPKQRRFGFQKPGSTAVLPSQGESGIPKSQSYSKTAFQALLAIFIHHPKLWSKYSEKIFQLSFPEDLDKLLKHYHLLNRVYDTQTAPSSESSPQNSPLSSSSGYSILQKQFSKTGNIKELNEILSTRVSDKFIGARSDATEAKACVQIDSILLTITLQNIEQDINSLKHQMQSKQYFERICGLYEERERISETLTNLESDL